MLVLSNIFSYMQFHASCAQLFAQAKALPKTILCLLVLVLNVGSISLLGSVWLWLVDSFLLCSANFILETLGCLVHLLSLFWTSIKKCQLNQVS
jgi:hypothetical protein